jgi:hypothetical protein
MTDAFVGLLLALAALSLGLRTVNALVPRLHPLARLIAGAIIGTAITTAILRICSSYHVHDLGLGVLVALAPAGIYDLVMWWFRWRRRPPV